MKTIMGKGAKPLKEFVENSNASGKPQEIEKGIGRAAKSFEDGSVTTINTCMHGRAFRIAIEAIDTKIAGF